jgi:hypothetical protein
MTSSFSNPHNLPFPPPRNSLSFPIPPPTITFQSL